MIMKKVIEYLVKHLVDKPDEVLLNEVPGGSTIVFGLHAGDGDAGKVIGKHDQTAHSLWTILSTVTAKNGQHSL